MNIFTRAMKWLHNPRPVPALRADDADALYRFAIQGALQSRGAPGWAGIAPADANRDYLTNLQALQSRMQDMLANNPEVGGWARMRTAQVIGRGLSFRPAMIPAEIGADVKTTQSIITRLTRLREIWSASGYADALGYDRTEASLQAQVFFTGLAFGTCLIHKVIDPARFPECPLSLEIIPGWRIETPIDRMGDPRILRGIEYEDDRRHRVIGIHVRKPQKGIGANATYFDYVYDFLPIDQVAVFNLMEVAGIDRAMPAAMACIKAFRDKSEFVAANLEAARKQAAWAVIVEKNADEIPYNAYAEAAKFAQQGAQTSVVESNPPGYFPASGPMLQFLPLAGMKANMVAPNLPAPDFPGFMEYHDQRLARGLNTPLSQYTRKVDTSYSGGMYEDRLDEGTIAQLREDFCAAWRKVHAWFVDAAYLAGSVALPGYSARSRVYFIQAHIIPPAKRGLNPVADAQAVSMQLAAHLVSPQQAAERDGGSYETILRQAAQAQVLRAEIEREHGLAPGALDPALAVKQKSAADAPTGDNAKGDNAKSQEGAE